MSKAPVFRTKGCAAHGHPEIAFMATDDLGAADHILEWLEEEVALGRQFLVGQTVQIGWTILKLAEGADCLELTSPDFRGLSVRWGPGVDAMLRHIQLHRLVCARLGTEPEFPSMLEFAAVSPTFCAAKGGFQMSREAVESPDRGWVAAEPGYASPEAQRMSLYELAVARPDITPFAARPPGSAVLAGENEVEVRYRQVVLSSSTDDVLAAWVGYGRISVP